MDDKVSGAGASVAASPLVPRLRVSGSFTHPRPSYHLPLLGFICPAVVPSQRSWMLLQLRMYETGKRDRKGVALVL